MMKSVFVVWKDAHNGMWHPVAKLTRMSAGYRLNYTKGAMRKGFIPFPRMNDTSKTYVSSGLFAFFKNRLMPQNRPEFRMLLKWSDIDEKDYDELDLLAISGGVRATDDYRIIPMPVRNADDEYKIRFFTSGINYLSDFNKDRIARLKSGEQVALEFEDDNQFDCNAVLVMTLDEAKVKLGYCPKYFNCDIRELISNPNLDEYSLQVVKVNENAPAQYRLLCEFTTKWPRHFTPMVSEDYLSASDELATA